MTASNLLIAVGLSFNNFNILLQLIKALQRCGICIHIINTCARSGNCTIVIILTILQHHYLSRYFTTNTTVLQDQSLLLNK